MHNLSAVVLAWQQDLTTALPGNGSVIDLVTQTGAGQSGRPCPAAPVSIISWAIIIQKSWAYRMAERHTRAFLQAFRRSAKFAEVQAACPAMPDSPLVGVFQAGYAEITAQLRRPAAGAEATRPLLKSLAAVDRALLRASAVEVNKLEKKVTFLATIASAAPFIGLFGTVWGIMDAFRQIGGTGSTNLSVDRPRHLGSAHRHRGGALRRDPGGLLLQPLHDQDQGAGVGNRRLLAGVPEHLRAELHVRGR